MTALRLLLCGIRLTMKRALMHTIQSSHTAKGKPATGMPHRFPPHVRKSPSYLLAKVLMATPSSPSGRMTNGVKMI